MLTQQPPPGRHLLGQGTVGDGNLPSQLLERAGIRGLILCITSFQRACVVGVCQRGLLEKDGMCMLGTASSLGWKVPLLN